MEKSSPPIAPNVENDPRGEIKVYSKPAKQSEQEVKNQPVYQQEPPKEKVVVQYKEKRSGLFGTGLGLRTIGCIGCWGPIILLVLLVVLIITKPTGIWGMFVDFLNADIRMPENQAMTVDNAKQEINSQIVTVGKNTILINESQLNALATNTLPQLKGLQTDIEEDGIRFFWKVDETATDHPLYGIIKIGENAEEEIYISQIGTQRVSLPEFLNQVISDSLISVIDLSNQTDKKFRLVYNLLSPDQNLKIDEITFEDDQLNLLVTVEANLF